MGEPLVRNKSIEDAAVTYVIEHERRRGRDPRDTRYRGAPADIESSDRAIEVKAAATQPVCDVSDHPDERIRPR